MASMNKNLNAINVRNTQTPATMAIPGRESEMAPNNNGGISFVIDDWSYFDRFLIIGPQNGNNAKSAVDVTDESVRRVISLIGVDGKRVIETAKSISIAGRAPKNDSAIVAIALAASFGSAEVQTAAYDAMLEVCRTGTHLFLFIQVLNQFGKWNAAAKRGVAAWYNTKKPDRLAVQLLKYQQRNGWSHRDVFRLAHIKPRDDVQNAMFRRTIKSEDTSLDMMLPALYSVVDELNSPSTDSKRIVSLIEQNTNVSWEMVPTQFLNDKNVLAALLPNMGMTAMIRQLGRFTTNGLTTPLSDTAKIIKSKILDEDALKKGRIHPITILTAVRSYERGMGRSGTTWRPDAQIVSALNQSFYKTFDFLEDTGAGVMLGIDCSGSMFSMAVGESGLVAADVAAAMAMAIIHSHENYFVGGFSSSFKPLNITKGMDLEQVLNIIQRFDWTSTNISSVAKYAQDNKIEVDVFGIITDNDVNTGIQPTKALNNYRKAMGKRSAQIVCATSMSNFTVADKADPYQIDIPGFDSSVPAIFSEFERLTVKK